MNVIIQFKFIRRLPIRMSEQVLHLSPGQTSSSNAIDSDSSLEKREVINKLQSKVTNLLINRNSNEKLVKSQDNLKRCLERLDKYKKINQDLQQKQNIFCDALGISYNSDLETIKKSTQDMKSKYYLLNAIQDELKITDVINLDQSNIVLDAIQKLKDKDSENNRFILKVLRILGIFTHNSSFENSQSQELPAALLLQEIQRIKEETEKLKSTVENFTYQQNEICQMLNIDTSNENENDTYTLYFRIKGAIKNIKTSLRNGIDEFDSSSSSVCQKKVDTPQIVKTAISDLQISTNKIKKDLYESEQKLKQTTTHLRDIEMRNEKVFKKLNFSSIEEISDNFEEMMKLMNASNPDILRRSIRQMIESNKSLQIQSNELNSKIQSLQINSQTLNGQLAASQDQSNKFRSKINELEAKKSSYKDELKELKSKMNAVKNELKSTSFERNNLRGQLTDKDEEIISLKELLQTEKGNVKAQFDELESQILSLKHQNRKSQQESESIRSDFENLQQVHNSLQQQQKILKNEKQNLESELESDKSKIRNLNKEIGIKSDEMDSLKTKNENLKQKNQNLQNEIDELTTEKSNLKRKLNDLNNQFESIQLEKSKFLSQLENEQKENQSLKTKIDENQLKISQLESSNSQLTSQIENLNKMKQDLLNKNNEYQKQISEFQLKIVDYEQNVQSMKFKVDQNQNEINLLKSERESLQTQINSLNSEIEAQRNENSELKKNIFQLQKENQTNKFNSEQKIHKLEMEIVESNKKLDQLKMSFQLQEEEEEKLNQNENDSISSKNRIDDVESKISQLIKENSELKRKNEENNQIIDEMTHNQNAYCKLLGINSDSSGNSIAESISDLLYDNKGMYTDNQSMKHQLASIASLLNIGESNNPGLIQSTINSLYDEIQHYEKEIERMNIEFNKIKQSNSKMCQILNVMNTDSLIDSISSVQSIINQIKQILNVSDDRIIDCIESLHESIQTLCDALNIDPKDSWIDSILAMYEALQDAAELLGITNSNQLSDAIQKIQLEKENFSIEINKLKEHIVILQKKNSDVQSECDRVNISLKDFQHQKTSLYQQVEELQKKNEDFYQQTEKIQQKNVDLNQQLSELSIENSDLSSRVELLQHEVDNLNQLNEDLKQQNSNFESESLNSSIFERQLSDICRQLQIKPTENQNVAESIAESIESLKKAKDEFMSFKWKVNRLLKIKKKDLNDSNNDSELNDDNKLTAETLREIETLNQLAFNLCRLFNVKSSDLLLDAAKKQDALIRQISPLFELFKPNKNDGVDEFQEWQQIVSEIKKVKLTNDKISSLLNVKDGNEMIIEIKKLQGQLSDHQSKEESNSQFFDELNEALEIEKDDKNSNINQSHQIQTTINELKENLNKSHKIFSHLSNLFNCEADYVVDFAELICKSMKNIAQILEISAKSPDLFSTVENVIKEMKEENVSLKKKVDEDKLFASQILNEMNLGNENTDEILHDALLKMKNVIVELKQQNDELKNNKDEKNQTMIELEDQIAVYKANNKKLFEKFDLYGRLENVNEDDKNLNSSESSKFKEIFSKIDEFKQIKKEYQKCVKKNKELSTKIRSIELENVRHVNQIRQSRNQINNVDDALKYMKSHEALITKLREIVGIPDAQFSAVVDKVLKMSDQLSSEIKYKEKLNQELKHSSERIHDFVKNEIEYKKLIDKQENKIDSLTVDIDKRDKAINRLESSLNNIFKSIGDVNVKSADFVVDVIEDQKKKIAELTKELSELKLAHTVDEAFDKISTNEKQQLKFIKKKIIEQTESFNLFLAKLQVQLENRNQNKEEIIRILKDAESDNFRLLDLLDPPLKIPCNLNSHIHIGNEYSMNPFEKQNADMFRKKRRNLDSDESNNLKLTQKKVTTENELISKKKKADMFERKVIAFNRDQRPRTSNANVALSASELIAQRKLREQTTLF